MFPLDLITKYPRAAIGAVLFMAAISGVGLLMHHASAMAKKDAQLKAATLALTQTQTALAALAWQQLQNDRATAEAEATRHFLEGQTRDIKSAIRASKPTDDAPLSPVLLDTLERLRKLAADSAADSPARGPAGGTDRLHSGPTPGDDAAKRTGPLAR